MSRWFRFYDDALNDPKVQRLAPSLFKAWVNLLCIASKGGGALPAIAEIAFSLRMTPHAAEAVIAELRAAGLFDDEDGEIKPHNWDGRQFKSDVSTERVQQFRERKRNVSVTAHETPPETEDRTEQNRTDSSLRSQRARAGRLPDDWVPDRAYAESQGLTGSEITREIERFRNYWKAKPGKDGAKLDWPATWRNWCIRAAESLGRAPPRGEADTTNGKFFVEIATPQWTAWRAHNGKSTPETDSKINGTLRRGWWFDSEWPPGCVQIVAVENAALETG